MRLNRFATAWFVCVIFILHIAIGGGMAADKLVLVAGGGTRDDKSVPAREARLREPFGVAFDRTGNVYICEMAAGERIRKIDRHGLLSTIAGTGEKGGSGDGGPALLATFNGVHNLAAAPNGDLWLADTWNHRVRKIEAGTGFITTVAGTGTKGFDGDNGPATAAQLGGIYCVTLNPTGRRLYLADLHNYRIRYLDLKRGTIHTLAGNGEKGIPRDGAPAILSPLTDPRAVAEDRQGNVYILERGGHALRVVKSDGTIWTVVNARGVKGNSGDGGPAREATLNGPKHLCIDPENNVVIADAENHLIRKYRPREEVIVRVAGCGEQGKAGLEGPPERAQLNRPHGVDYSPAGELHIVDSYNDRVLKITRSE
ncbi:MAG: hypothetical protein AB1813_15745 [Verrucomicrobiota bacterium]